MSKDITKKAAEMLLKGGTLLAERCPYCKGVRVIKDGYALCVSCGREPEKKGISKENPAEKTESTLVETLQKKMKTLSEELEQEDDSKRQQEILKSINLLMDTMEKIKNRQGLSGILSE